MAIINFGDNKNFTSKLEKCYIFAREKDADPGLFCSTSQGILCNLDGYAIIPREDFEGLYEKAMGKKFDSGCSLSDVRDSVEVSCSNCKHMSFLNGGCSKHCAGASPDCFEKV